MRGQYQYKFYLFSGEIPPNRFQFAIQTDIIPATVYNIFRPSPQQAGIGMTAALSAIGATPSESEPQNAKYALFYLLWWDSMTVCVVLILLVRIPNSATLHFSFVDLPCRNRKNKYLKG